MLAAGQPVVRRRQHAVEGAGRDGAGRGGRLRPPGVPEAAAAPGRPPAVGKGKGTQSSSPNAKPHLQYGEPLTIAK